MLLLLLLLLVLLLSSSRCDFDTLIELSLSFFFEEMTEEAGEEVWVTDFDEEVVVEDDSLLLSDLGTFGVAEVGVSLFSLSCVLTLSFS